MSEILQVGKVVYEIRGNNPLFLNKYDCQFQNQSNNYEKWIPVDIRDKDEIGLSDEGEKYISDSFLTIMNTRFGERRYYKAAFLNGYPIYASSILFDNKIDIDFNFRTGAWENPNMQIWNLIHLESLLLETNGIPLHCCYTMYQNQAILFSAPSGTGKTTQAEIWKRVYHSEIINGDKCLLQKDGDAWEAWGFPMHGSADECLNQNFPIKAIAIVRQAPVDQVIELNTIQKLGLIYSECTVNSWNQEHVQKALDLIGDLISKVTVLQLNCTMNDSAAEVLHQYLYNHS